MTKRILSCLTLLAVLGLVPLEASGATFRLPDTAPNPPVSVARVYLEFNADLPADAALVAGSGIGLTVNGFSGVVELAPPGAPLPAVDDNGEDFARLFKTGARTAVLTIDTNRFLQPAVAPATGFNRCQQRGGIPANKDYTINLAGLGATQVSRFGLTGLAATRFEEGGTVTTYCNCSSRRMKGLTWPTPFPGAEDRKRAPMDILVVLDQSGSMSLPMTPGSATTRWGALESAVGQFIANWSEETLTPGVELEKAQFQDRLGLVYFSTNTDEPLAASPFFIPRGAGLPGPGHAWKPFETDILTARDPLAMTALGQGILYAVNKAKTEGITGNDPTIIVMTDGMQNITPVVVPAVSGDDIGSLALDDSGTLKVLRAQCIPMLTLSLGDVTSPYAELMHQISVETAGTAGLTTGSNLPVDFLQKLVEALKGNTLSMVLKHDGVLPLRVGRATTPVLLDGTVESALVTLSWLGSSNQKPLKLQIINPDGVAVTPTAISSGPTYVTQRVDLPKLGKAGTWRLDVSTSDSGAIPYKLTVLAEEGRLDFRNTVLGTKHPVGQPLTLVTDLTLDGKPVEDLSGELRVRMERPVAALGTLLHETKTQSRPQEAREPLTGYQLKVDTLLQDPDFAAKMGTRKDDTPLVMKHTGKGRYELAFEDTKFPGTYRFHFELEMKGPEGEPIYRLETVSAVVEVIPNGTVSDVKSEQTGDRDFTLSFLPRDADGNVMGPGYDGRIQVRIDGKGTVKAVANPGVDGNYQVMLTEIEKDTPIVVFFAGTPIAQGTPAEPKPMKPGEPPPTLSTGGPGPGPTPNGPSCGCRRMSSGGMLGLMGLVLLGFISRPRRHRDDE